LTCYKTAEMYWGGRGMGEGLHQSKFSKYKPKLCHACFPVA